MGLLLNFSTPIILLLAFLVNRKQDITKKKRKRKRAPEVFTNGNICAILRMIFREVIILHKRSILKLANAGMLFALGLVLPFLTGQIPEIGNLLLPMHLPVLLCGFVCGPIYGSVVGFTLPLVRSFIFGMPALFPSAVTMAFELMAYGFFTAFIYSFFKKKTLLSIYLSLIPAMLIGRAVKGVANAIAYGISDKAYSFGAFISGAFAEAVPGIILQLILIPAVLIALRQANLK